MDTKHHWENVFTNKRPTEVSWYQQVPETSIRLFEENKVEKKATIIDVGCGDSYFIDYLVENGYENIYALDISEAALERLKKRLGPDADKVNWVVSNVLEFNPGIQFDFWHDRAAFHFQTGKEDIDTYVNLVSKIITPGGILALGTFSENGPKKCSGLDITQYSQQSMAALFQKDFEKQYCINEDHTTPFGTVQNFTFCVFKKN